MKILAIDTSCDDTSVAISEDKKILSNVLWSKIKTHNKWGGVVPSEAKRQHEEFLAPVIEHAFDESGLRIENIDIIAVTYGPGLAIALEPGIQKAKKLSQVHKIPLIAVNHMIGHIYSSLTENSDGLSESGTKNFEFPLLSLAISGGHTDLYLMSSNLEFKQIGETLDDAVGEAFDKVGRILGMGFPAGAKIEEAAKLGDSNRFKLPRPMQNSGDYNWSFSGLKTAVLYEVRKEIGDYESKPGKKTYKMEDASAYLSEEFINDMAASFQLAAVESITKKVTKGLLEYNPKMFVVGGGVIANTLMREKLSEECKKLNIPIYYPKPLWLCTDNASMIAIAAYYYATQDKYVDNLEKLDRIPNLRI